MSTKRDSKSGRKNASSSREWREYQEELSARMEIVLRESHVNIAAPTLEDRDECERDGWI